METRVTIIVRTQDNSTTVRRVLEGVRSQAFRDYELVIVDSGSTDGTLAIVRGYPHKFVDYSNRPFTFGGSLNAGCAVAKGEYVVSLSSHCVPLHDRWLSNLVGALDEDVNLAGAYGQLVFNVEDYPVGSNGAVEVMDLEAFRRRPNAGLRNSNSIFRRNLWLDHPFPEDVRLEDQSWAEYHLTQGYTTAKVHGTQVLYDSPYSPLGYACKMMRASLALNDQFGYEPSNSAKQLYERTVGLVESVVSGRRSFEAASFAMSSVLGRFAADSIVRYRKAKQQMSGGQAGRARHPRLGPRQGLATPSRLDTALDREGPRAPTGLAKSRRVTVGQQPNQVFFLVGEMRSGTSWLSRMLNTHPEVFCRGEGSFFGSQQDADELRSFTGQIPSLFDALAGSAELRQWHSLPWNGWARGDAEEDVANLTRLAVDYFLIRGSESSGKTIVGDKSPAHSDCVDEIHGFYPEAKIIHIVRDGRDVAVSLMHHFWRLQKQRGDSFSLEPEEVAKRDAYLQDPEGFLAAGNSIFTEGRLVRMASRWRRRVTKASSDGTKLFGPTGYHQLRYEDLSDRTEESLRPLFELLGARTDVEVIERCVEKNRFERLAKRERGQEDSNSFFRKGVAGEWRSVFTARDHEVYNEAAGDTLAALGYDIKS